jgi:hypothetical protein
VCDFAVQKQTNLTKTEIPLIDLPLLLKEPPISVFLGLNKNVIHMAVFICVCIYNDISF